MAEAQSATKDGRAAGEAEDLSAEIIRSIAKAANEQVTCKRITKDYYRCNWWTMDSTSAYDNPGMAALLVTTSRITKSQFLCVTKSEGKLEITNRSAGPNRANA